MTLDGDRLARLLSADADISNRHRVRAVLQYLEIRDTDIVLDCGCGLGWFSRVIGDLYACRLYAIDVDTTRLARAAEGLNGRATLMAGEAGALPFRAQSFDKIVLTEVLEHVSNERAVLEDIHRVLKPDGVLAITVPNRGYPFWWDPVNRCRERLGLDPIRRGLFGGIWTNHLRLYHHDEIVDLVRRANFTIEESRTMVRYCLPFAHNLVYGLGKVLVESGAVKRADRFVYASAPPSRLHPLTWVLALLTTIDRLNANLPQDGEPAVSIAVKARRR